MELSELKIKVEEFRQKFSNEVRPHWPKAFRKVVLAQYQAGHSIFNLSKATGIPHQTIRKWTLSLKKEVPPKHFKQLKVIKEEKQEMKATSICLSWGEGLKADGLNIDDLKTLLREGLL